MFFIQFKTTASSSLNVNCLDLISAIFILPPIHEADYLVLLYRLQSDLQESQAAIKRLTQTANSDVTSESGESPDIVPSSSLPSLSSFASNTSTMAPDIMVSDNISEEGELFVNPDLDRVVKSGNLFLCSAVALVKTK